MRHTFLTHTNCKIPNCAICSGIAKICTVCGCTSPRLTSECYGAQLKASQITRIHEGTLDFVKAPNAPLGRWVDSRHGELIDDVLPLEVGQTFDGVKEGIKWVYIGKHATSDGVNVHHFVQQVIGKFLGDKQGYKAVRHINELAKFIKGDFDNDSNREAVGRTGS